MNASRVHDVLKAAVLARQKGDILGETRLLEQAVALEPGNAYALNALGMQRLAGQDFSGAADYFARATAADPHAAPLWLNLAKAHRLRGDNEGERESLERVLGIDRRHLTALVRLAELHERLGEKGPALERWTAVAAIVRQIDDRSAELDSLLERASTYIAEQASGFAETVDKGLEEARMWIAPRDRRRFDACIDHVLGRRPIYVNECAGLHYPFLPADEFFDREHFPWLRQLEARTDDIRAELETLLRGDQQGLKPYVKLEPGTPQNKWSALDNSLDWSAFFFWEYGRKHEEACARCPVTAALLESLPLCDLPGRAPNAFFSLLRPRAHIPPHTGVSNTRAIIHLPLIIPEGCRLRVGGETREWKIGEAMAFDDTIEHEAWNDSDQIRAVLIIDTWNPHLTEVERDLLKTFCSLADASAQNPGFRVG